MTAVQAERIVPHPRSADRRLWVFALVTCLMWLEELRYTVPAESPVPAWLATLLGVASQLAFTSGEAWVAVAAWRIQGTRVRWAALAPRVLVASAPETLALSIASGHASLPAPIAEALAGPRASGAAPQSGMAFAFAGAGALALVRLLLSAHLQSRAAGAGFARGLATVAALWLATRLLMWWAFELLQGRSFQP